MVNEIVHNHIRVFPHTVCQKKHLQQKRQQQKIIRLNNTVTIITMIQQYNNSFKKATKNSLQIQQQQKQ